MEDLIIKATPIFEKRAKALLTEEAYEELLDYLEANPDKGDLIPGTSGVRKIRWKTGKNDQGKRGGVRVLYHYSKGILVLLITMYSKTEKENVTQRERNELKRTIPLLVKKYLEDL
jgi:mRNA-degrading endonuclease RelE of RelBE toxin-antitoxin system